MRFVKVVKQDDKNGFEEDINEILKENERAKLIDIKINSSYNVKRELDSYLAVLVFVG